VWDTPVLTVVDPAVAPAQRTRPKRVLGTTLAMLAGGVLGMIAVYAGAFRNRVRRDSAPDYLDFQAAWDEATGRSRRLS
jgi:uncharacterized protein involved in exopolysaccharide biosynthesis